MITKQELLDRGFKDCLYNKGTLTKYKILGDDESFGLEVNLNTYKDIIIDINTRDFDSNLDIRLSPNTPIEDIDHLIRILSL